MQELGGQLARDVDLGERFPGQEGPYRHKEGREDPRSIHHEDVGHEVRIEGLHDTADLSKTTDESTARNVTHAKPLHVHDDDDAPLVSNESRPLHRHEQFAAQRHKRCQPYRVLGSGLHSVHIPRAHMFHEDRSPADIMPCLLVAQHALKLLFRQLPAAIHGLFVDTTFTPPCSRVSQPRRRPLQVESLCSKVCQEMLIFVADEVSYSQGTLIFRERPKFVDFLRVNFQQLATVQHANG
mmetsp:Transcript_151634/g.486568  ORF Transcript_151634/g.486568 Transcript_151634/m.486568 type:complete len:239 (+) Transcript_151634:134-850(+)